ncbi:MAG TPA: lysylphosphatidylglycerol synthase transmembrane domain-containing protein [Kofleriaceae bacterium]|jgi:hypothetical protein
MSEPTGRKTLKRVIRWVLIIGVSVLAVQFVRKLDPAKAMAVVADASVGWIALAMGVNAVLRVGTRVLRTRSLLKPLPGDVPLRELAHFIYGAMALGYIVSPVAGSAARVFALQHHGVSSESLVAVQLWEKIISGCAFAVFSAPMLLLDTPSQVHYALLACTLAGSIGFVVALVAMAGVKRYTRARVEPTGKIKRWLFSMGKSLALLHSPKTLASTFVWSALSELSDVGMLALALHAVGAPVNLAACVLAFIVVNVGSAVPSTPGQLGVFEATTAWGLTAAGVADEKALAVGLIYHLIHIVPVLLIGLPSLLRIRREQKAEESMKLTAAR